MGYREDGNFNINWNYDGLVDPGQYAKQNSDFLYPDKGIRFLQAQAALDTAMGRITNLTKGDYKLHRGYIRNLEQPSFGEVPITRCNFQFNPQQIQQNVAMREDVYLPILQAPEQLAQPLGAQVNFSFDLLFDRSHELAKGSPSSGLGYQGTADNAERNTPGLTANPDTIGENDAYDIGVLADLRVFYSVIGQGFSREMIDFQAQMFKYNADAAFGASVGSADGSSGSTTPPTDPRSPNMTDIEQLINSNVGNFGLLMPMPVRVVFSSLFMVDGFVTGTSVDFLKFSTKMVPTQCRIAVSMNALYIGFARQKTFITDVFERAAESARREAEEKESARKELLSALNLSCKSFIIGASFEPMTSNAIDWDKASTLSHQYEHPIWPLAVDNNATGKKRNLFLGFPDIKPIRGGDLNIVIRGEEVTLKEGQDKDAILALYEAGVAVSFSYTWSITVYGRIPGVANKPPLTEKMARDYMNGDLTSEQIAAEKITILGSYSGTETSNSENEWGKGTSGDGVASERIRRRSIRDKKFVNTASGAYKNMFDASWGNASYFVIEISVNFSVSSGGGTPVTASYSSKEVRKGDRDFDRRIIVNWDSNQQTYNGDPYIPIGTISNPGII